MTDEQPTPQMPPDPPPRPPLARSSQDTVIAGVAGGIGKHLNVDPLAIRITFVILSFAGGLGILAYLACLAFMPVDDPEAPPRTPSPPTVARTVGAGLLAVAAVAILIPGWVWGPGFAVLLAAGVIVYLLIRVVREEGTSHLTGVAARIGIGIVLLALAVGGFTAAAAGEAVGGGIAVAGLISACGVGLVGGAFRGGARWLIAPAIVLAVPLAAVAATDLDLEGSWGDRTFRPVTAAQLADGYEMGLGAMKIDLRDVDLPPGRTELPLDLGMGEIQVLVPEDTCVVTDAAISVGAADTGDGEHGGIDVDVRDDRVVAPGVSYLHIDADIGIGAIRVGDRADGFSGNHWRDGVRPGTSLAACEGSA